MTYHNEKGVLYCAIGEKYYKYSVLSANSIKRYALEINCAICTDQKVNDPLWDKVIPITKSQVLNNQYMKDKLIALTKSPYDKTLYLDADTYVMDNISELFLILEKFDFAVCHGHCRQLRYDIQHGKTLKFGVSRVATLPEIPYAFAPIQGGLFLYNNNDKMKKWLDDLLDLYIEKDYYDDQTSVRELLWTTDIRFYILPPEYNFFSINDLKKWKNSRFKIATPKIFHYTIDKYYIKNIPKFLSYHYNINKLEKIKNETKWYVFKEKIKRKRRRLIYKLFFS